MGKYERERDRYQTMHGIAVTYLKSLGVVGEGEEFAADAFLHCPANAQEIMASGTPDDSTPKGKHQRALLNGWVHRLERDCRMGTATGSSSIAPLPSPYS